MTAVAVVLAFLLACGHVFAGRLRFLGTIPRSRWLSVAGGIAVAYVFVQLLPELAEASEHVGQAVPIVERPAYLLALAGLALFYGVERYAKQSRQRTRSGGGQDKTSSAASWFSFASYAIYNAVIGYVLVRHQDSLESLLLFAVAMGLHFLVNDQSLREHHREDYHRVGRWLVAFTIVVGALVGAVTRVHPAIIAALVAFIAGGVVLNVMKEELPAERESSFPAFAVGAVAYTALLLAI